MFTWELIRPFNPLSLLPFWKVVTLFFQHCCCAVSIHLAAFYLKIHRPQIYSVTWPPLSSAVENFTGSPFSDDIPLHLSPKCFISYSKTGLSFRHLPLWIQSICIVWEFWEAMSILIICSSCGVVAFWRPINSWMWFCSHKCFVPLLWTYSSELMSNNSKHLVIWSWYLTRLLAVSINDYWGSFVILPECKVPLTLQIP